jgi:hypothetical protein
MKHHKLRIALLGAGVCSAFTASPVSAVEVNLGGFDGSFNSTITMGAGRRLQNPSCALVGDPAANGGSCGSAANPDQWSAGDDGNLNYRKGDFFTTYLKGTHELLLKSESGLKFFARGTWKKDWTADDTQRTDLSSDARGQIVNNTELLDYWVSQDFNVGDQNARVKLGNQVISWGEALFYIGGVSNNVLDFQKLLVPGTQLKEAFLPVKALSVSGALSSTVNAEAFYQFRWRRTRVAPVGSYFSVSDIYDRGRVPVSFAGTNFNVTGLDAYALTGRRSLTDAEAMDAMTANGDFAVPVLADRKAKNSGQYGVSVKWAPEGSTVNLGAYAMNYHDQFPVLNVVGGAAYQWSFQENRKMYGVSANFPLGNWAIGTELSYRPKDAVALGGCFTPGGPLDANVNFNPNPTGDCPLYADFKKYQLSVTALLQLQKSEHAPVLGLLGADSAFLSMEAAVTRYSGLGKTVRRTINGVEVEQPIAAGYFVPLDRSGAYPIATSLGTATSWGYVVDFNWTYDGRPLTGWSLTPGVTFSHNVKGDTPNYSAQFLEGNKSINAYLLLNQNPTKWQFGLNVTKYFGGENDVVKRQYFADRDFIGGFAAYSF